MKEDNILVQKVAQGDQHALETLYDRYESLLYSFLMKMTGRADLAEEVIQEVFFKLWRKKVHFNPAKGKFSSWLLSVTRNQCIDLMRKRKITYEYTEEQDALQVDSANIEKTVVWKEKQQFVQHCIEALKADQRETVESFYYQGFTQKDIAQRINIPPGTVKSRLRLALKHLKDCLTKKGVSLSD
ncbi:RNA polymerase sigma factor [Bacillus tianshenii]|nr:RNA polymerase sigma factor [Bacillus tianshenii]